MSFRVQRRFEVLMSLRNHVEYTGFGPYVAYEHARTSTRVHLPVGVDNDHDATMSYASLVRAYFTCFMCHAVQFPHCNNSMMSL